MWAYQIFHDVFEEIPEFINIFITDPNYVETTKKRHYDVLFTLRIIKEFMITHHLTTYEDCARWSRGKYEELFEDQINEILAYYPRDYITEMGLPFWRENRRAPFPIPFSPDNEEIRHFIKAAADIMAHIFQFQLVVMPWNLQQKDQSNHLNKEQEHLMKKMKKKKYVNF